MRVDLAILNVVQHFDWKWHAVILVFGCMLTFAIPHQVLKADDSTKDADFVYQIRPGGDQGDSRRLRRLENELEDLEDENDRLRRQISDLQGKLREQGNINDQIVDKVKEIDRELKETQRQKDRLAEMQQRMQAMSASVGEVKAAQKSAGQAVLRMAMDKEWEWASELFADEQQGEIYFQHVDGQTTTQRFWSLNRKKIGVRSMFQNTSESTGQFFIKFAVMGKPDIEGLKETKRVLGSSVYTTPSLAPGETCEFVRWVPVINATDVKSVEMVGVMRRYELAKLPRQ